MVIPWLKAHGHPFPYEHLRFEGAGQPMGLCSAPGVIRTGLATLGGSLGVNSLAGGEPWTTALGFLRQILR